MRGRAASAAPARRRPGGVLTQGPRRADEHANPRAERRLMARPQQRTPTRRRRGPGDRVRPRKYTRINVAEIDYKDLATLRRFISDRGKIRSRRVTGLSRAH